MGEGGPREFNQGADDMGTVWIHESNLAGAAECHDMSGNMMVARCLAAAADGDAAAYFDLGVAFSTGSNGIACDLVEAHKWFNLAAVAGHVEAQMCRADISEEMTAREIAEAQRRARHWIAATSRRAA